MKVLGDALWFLWRRKEGFDRLAQSKKKTQVKEHIQVKVVKDSCMGFWNYLL